MQGLLLLALGARVVVMSGLSENAASLPIGDLYTRDITICGFAISNASTAELTSAAARINQLLIAGKLAGRIGTTFSLAEAAKAQDATGKTPERIIITP